MIIKCFDNIKTSPRVKQSGTTLISLMVGMLVSILAILACLSLFSDLIRVSAESTIDAKQDGGLAAAMLRIQTELQSAGYNMSAGPIALTALDFINVANTNNSTSTIAWRYKDYDAVTGTLKPRCRRFFSQSVADGGKYTLQLETLKEPSCVDGVDLSNATWIPANIDTTETILKLDLFDIAKNAAGTTTFNGDALITFGKDVQPISSKICTPFGLTVGTKKRPVVKLRKLTAAGSNLDSSLRTELEVCFLNAELL